MNEKIKQLTAIIHEWNEALNHRPMYEQESENKNAFDELEEAARLASLRLQSLLKAK